ncbi:MAG: DUF748 domain-containing protein [Candidatus Omnitrophica bacterium]|nr:DUF748 domain-containing protein [Candidatus Omnitrophota bacterium]
MTKIYITKQLSFYLKRNISIEQLKLNPYKLSLHIRNLFISEKENNDTFFSSPKVDCRISFLSLIKAKLVISDFYIAHPYIKIMRYEKNSYNFSDLLRRRTLNNEKKVFYFSIHNLKIEDGVIIFDDIPLKRIHTIKKINFTLPFFSNSPFLVKKYTQPSFSAIVNKTLIKIEGKIKPFSNFQEIEFNVNVNNLDLSKYFVYIPLSLNFNIVSGYLNGNFKISFINPIRKKTSLILKCVSELLNLEIVDISNYHFLKIPKFKMICSFDLLNKEIEFSELSTISPEIWIVREKDMNFNIFKVFPAKKLSKEKGIFEKPLKFNLKNIIISDGKIFFFDRTLTNPPNIKLNNVIIKCNEISNKKDRVGHFYFSGETDEQEFIKISGTASSNPILSEGTLKIKNLLLKKYFPYYKNNLFFNLETGNLTLEGNYNLNLKNREVKFSKTNFELKKLYCKKNSEESFIIIPILNIENISFNFSKKEFIADTLTSQKGLLNFSSANNKFQFFPWNLKKETNFNINDWKIYLKQIRINDYTFQIKDISMKESILIEKFNFLSSDITSYKTKNIPVDFSLQINKKGVISSKGYIVLKPLKGNFQIETSEIFLPSFQLLISQKLNLSIIDGVFSSKGILNFEKNLFFSDYNGEATIQKLKTVDNIQGNDLLFIEFANFKNINHKQNYFEISEISIDKFYGNIIIYSDRTINIMHLLKNREKNDKPEENNFNIYFKKIFLKQGQINLIDKNVQYEHSEIFKLDGIITDLYITGRQQNIEFQVNFEDIRILQIIDQIKSLIRKPF